MRERRTSSTLTEKNAAYTFILFDHLVVRNPQPSDRSYHSIYVIELHSSSSDRGNTCVKRKQRKCNTRENFPCWRKTSHVRDEILPKMHHDVLFFTFSLNGLGNYILVTMCVLRDRPLAIRMYLRHTSVLVSRWLSSTSLFCTNTVLANAWFEDHNSSSTLFAQATHKLVVVFLWFPICPFLPELSMLFCSDVSLLDFSVASTGLSWMEKRHAYLHDHRVLQLFNLSP